MYMHNYTMYITCTCIYLCYKENPDSGVWSNEFNQHLSSDIAQKLLNMLSDERVLHYGTSAITHVKVVLY